MSDAASEKEVAARVRAACERRGIYDEDVFLVHALLAQPPSRWPGCCGSGCQPCMADVCDAALEVKRSLEPSTE